MKKIFILITSFLIFAALFAEQPFFLKNWIVPEDIVWGTKTSIPQIEGLTFDQAISNGDLEKLEVKPFEQSGVSLPPYLLEHKLADWNMTYAQILKAFSESKEFDVYENISASADFNHQENGLSFEDTIVAVAKEDRSFEIIFSFGDLKSENEKMTVKPKLFRIFYYDLSGDLDPRKYWNENNELEKTIIALTAFDCMGFGIVPEKFDCTLKRPYTNSFYERDAKGWLTDIYFIHNKEELYKEIDTDKDWNGITYDELNELIQKNPDKKPYEIAEQFNRDVDEVARMYFIKAMNTKMGKYHIKFDDLVSHLFLLRLALGAGYINKAEALEKSRPLVEQILSWYSSYEDYAIHRILSYSYTGSYTLSYSSDVSSTLFLYNQIKNQIPLEEIKFNGNNSDKTNVVKIKEAYYLPQSDEELFWGKLSGETYLWPKLDDLPLIEEGINRFGKLKILNSLFEKMRLSKYDGKQPAESFFENNYRDFWNKLPELEKYAIAFSNNLFELNRQFHLDFDNRIKLSSDSSNPKELLKESWGISNHDELVEMFNSLEEYGHSGAYAAILDLIQKNPGKSLIQISQDEGLSITDTSRLFFVNEMKDVLGAHGLEAWDQAREITILRWGIGSGYISEDEVKALIEPVVAKIRQNYTSYEDFICHYIAGRQFYGLYEGNYRELAEKAKTASENAYAYIPINEIKFTAENADKEHIMNYKNMFFMPSETCKKCEKFVSLYSQKVREQSVVELEKLETQYPEFKNIVFYWHLSLLSYFNSAEELVQFTEANMNYLMTLKKDDEIFANSMYIYMQALNNSSAPEKALKLYDTLPDYLKYNVYYYYQFAYSNYLMLAYCNTQAEYDAYRNTAENAFKLLKDNNFQLSEIIENWLNLAD